MERLQKESGWSKVFIPQLKDELELCESELRVFGVSQGKSDYLRGKIDVLRKSISFAEDRLKIATCNMSKSTDKARMML